jgi:DNA repair exonuclease SbcCD nuclease subunit
VEQTGWRSTRAEIRLLCMHQTVEGAKVGPAGFVFREGDDIVPGRNIPGQFAAVLSGHIHRAQRLRVDLRGNPLASPVLYPGSIERTSFAERDETKGYLLLKLVPSSREGGSLTVAKFIPLPARPMRAISLAVDDLTCEAFTNRTREALAVLEPDAVVRLTLTGAPRSDLTTMLTASVLRSLAPPSMNVDLAAPGIQH